MLVARNCAETIAANNLKDFKDSELPFPVASILTPREYLSGSGKNESMSFRRWPSLHMTPNYALDR